MLICFIFFSVGNAQNKPQDIAKTEARNIEGKSISSYKTLLSFQRTAKKKFPNIFRPIGGFFKRVFGVKPKLACTNYLPFIERIAFTRIAFMADCPLSETSGRYLCRSENQSVTLTTIARDPENDPLIYNYEVSAGQIVRDGAKAIWDLSVVEPGTYSITTTVDDGCGICVPPFTEQIRIVDCQNYQQLTPLCSHATVSANQSTVKESETITFTGHVYTAGVDDEKLKYDWKISAGYILSGQGTKELTIEVPSRTAGSYITASFDIEDDGICEPQTSLPIYVSPN